MTRTFIELPIFTKRWQELNFNDDTLRELQKTLLRDPESGVMMQGTGGIRKIRVAFNNRGKSGSARVCYVDFSEYSRIYLITVFAKKEQDNLTDAEKTILKHLVKQLKEEAAQVRRSVL